MTDPSHLLATLVGRGVRLEVHGDKLRYAPQSAVDDELQRELRRHKAALMQILRADPEHGDSEKPPPENGRNGESPPAPVVEDGLREGPVVTSVWGKATVSVVITCHDYGRYLESAILSVLGQTWPVDEILVVDDASSDNTPEIAAQFAAQGVDYLRVENRSAHLSRRDGFRNTQGNFVLFLDADNYLLPDYVRTGLREFVHRHVAVVYADLQCFGRESRRTNFPAFSRAALMRSNFVDANAIIRREALEVSRAFEIEVDPEGTHEDYVMYQSLAREGWDFRKQATPVQYRTHDRQHIVRKVPKFIEGGYFLENGMQYQEATLFIPLAGRREAFRVQSRFLERQTWDHDRLRLVFCDTSRDPDFGRLVRQWIAECDYTDVRHLELPLPKSGLADVNRRSPEVEREVQLYMCRIYNRLRTTLETDYCWILEDDVIPPDDVLERLLRSFAPDVGAVCAPYPSRWDPNYVVWIDRDGIDAGENRPDGSMHTVRAKKPASGEPQVVEVRGSGFGCLVLRSELLENHVFTIPEGELFYDPYFFRLMGDHWRRLCDWSCECEHLGAWQN